MRAGSRCSRRSSPSCLRLVAWGRFDPAQPGFQLVEQRDWFSPRHPLQARRRRHFDAVRAADDLPDAVLHRRLVAVDPDAREGIHDRLPGAGDADDRRLLALDLVLFYLFFEGGLIPMFLIIGIWGRQPRLCGFKFFLYTLAGSVLMLLAIMAMYWTAGTTDITVLLKTPFRVQMQKWLWLAFLRLVRRQDADVAGPYLAARRACRGADGGLGHPGRHPAEDGRLRIHPLLAADVSRRVALFRAAGVRACRSSRSSTPRWSRWCRRT